MVNKKTIEKALFLFFHFNYMEGSDSVDVSVMDYDDDFFRWYNDSFKHEKKLTCIVDDKKIILFETAAIRERLLQMRGKVSANDDKTIFGCHIDLVKDLAKGGIKIDKFNEIDDLLIERMERSEKDATEIILQKDEAKLNKGV